VARIKDRHETHKRSLSGQVNCLEKEMLQIRSQLNTALKERDETRFRYLFIVISTVINKMYYFLT